MLIVCPSCSTGYEVNAEAIGNSGRTVRCSFCRKQWFETAPSIEAVGIVAGPQFAPPPTMAPSAPSDDEAEIRASDQPMPDEPASTAVDETPVEESLESLWEIPQTSSPSLAPDSRVIEGAASPAEVETSRAPRTSRARWRLDRVKLPLTPVLIALQFALICAGVLWRNEIVHLLPQTASLFRAVGLEVNTRGLVFADIRISRDDHDGITVLVVEGTIANTARGAVSVPRLRLALRNAASAELVSWTAPPGKSTLRAGETMPFRSRLVSPPAGGSDILVRFINRQDFVSGAR